jgi:hypothetical protein
MSPRSSGDRAPPSEGGGAGSNPAGGTFFRRVVPRLTPNGQRCAGGHLGNPSFDQKSIEIARKMRAGRGVRVVVGVALIAWGIFMSSAGELILANVGAVVLLAGALNFCLIALLLRVPFSGKASLGSH